jgi:DNA mismatch repair protein MutS
LAAREAMFEREFQLFEQVVADVTAQSKVIQATAQLIAHLDVLTNFADLALKHQYVKPTLTTDKVLSLKHGRHPVVEQYLGSEFVPNSTELTDQQRFMLLTGPNMAGKSTYIRQVSLIVIMAHMGCFVPADHAIIPLSDRVFSRIGASDALHKGLSTFMVEMTETAKIIHHLTERSLVIFDEIGRGTGTRDGMSIAQAIAEFVATVPAHPFIFFATHYHELSELSSKFSAIQNFTMGVTVHKGKVIFLRTVLAGSSDESYGVEVARQAGIPISIIRRAETLKRELAVGALQFTKVAGDEQEEKVAALIEALMKINLDDLSPKEAWKELEKLKGSLSQKS